MSRRLLVLCPDPVGERMSGMGIRYAEIARALAGDGVEVTLAARAVHGASPAGLRCATWAPDRPGALRGLVADADVVLTPPAAPHVVRVLRRAGVRVAVDLYDPEVLEVLERFATDRAPLRALHVMTTTDKLSDTLRNGHFFVCASERQRDLWLGALLALGLVRPADYDRDPTLRSVIDVVPFGVPAQPPAPDGCDPIRARFAGIGPGDRVVLWNGGLWRWLDAPSAIRALARLRERGVPAHLVVMGASSAGGAEAAQAEARAVADREGVTGAVWCNDTWVEYERRGDWLRHADVAISTHRDHLETRFAFRTRLLDCFWAGLPAVVSAGDALAEEIAAHDLGAVASPGDVEGLGDGLERVLARGRESYAEALRDAAQRHEWPRVVAPLRAYVLGEVPGTSPRRNPLAVAPAVHARRAAQRVTRAARALRR